MPAILTAIMSFYGVASNGQPPSSVSPNSGMPFVAPADGPAPSWTEKDPHARTFLATVDAVSKWFDTTSQQVEELEAAPGLAAVKEQQRKTVGTTSPFPGQGQIFAWPFWLYEVKNASDTSVHVSIRPAVLPPVLDAQRFAVLQYNLESGGVGAKTGINGFGAPRTVLVDESSTNELWLQRAPEVYSKWQPVIDGDKQIGVNTSTTWFWLTATSGNRLTRGELLNILNGNGGPDRVEIQCTFYRSAAVAAKESKSVVPKRPELGFSDNTKSFAIIDGHGSLQDLLKKSVGQTERSRLLRVNERPSLFEGPLRVQGTSSFGLAGTGRIYGLEHYFQMLNSVGIPVAASNSAPGEMQGARPVAAEREPPNLPAGSVEGGPVDPNRITVRFDLSDASDDRVMSRSSVEIKTEPDGTTYWAPNRLGQPGEVTYEISIPKPIAGIEMHGVGVNAYNDNADVSFDPNCSAVFQVSTNGEDWFTVDRTSSSGRTTLDVGECPGLVGATTFYLKARLRVTRIHEGDRVRYAQFLRSNPGRGEYPKITFLLETEGSDLTPPTGMEAIGRRAAPTVFTVESLTANAGLAEILWQHKSEPASTPYVLLTGLVPYGKQVAEYAARFNQADHREPARDTPVWSQFLVERALDTDGEKLVWERVDAAAAADTASRHWRGIQPDSVSRECVLSGREVPEFDRDESLVSRFAYAMPLPLRGDRPWNEEAVHPWFARYVSSAAAGSEPAGTGAEYRLFRFIDLHVEPGASYRYRVRLSVWNPNYRLRARYLTSEDVGSSAKLASDPSEMSPLVVVPNVP